VAWSADLAKRAAGHGARRGFARTTRLKPFIAEPGRLVYT
jgi:hypothetical protein